MKKLDMELAACHRAGLMDVQKVLRICAYAREHICVCIHVCVCVCVSVCHFNTTLATTLHL